MQHTLKCLLEGRLQRAALINKLRLPNAFSEEQFVENGNRSAKVIKVALGDLGFDQAEGCRDLHHHAQQARSGWNLARMGCVSRGAAKWPFWPVCAVAVAELRVGTCISNARRWAW